MKTYRPEIVEEDLYIIPETEVSTHGTKYMNTLFSQRIDQKEEKKYDSETEFLESQYVVVQHYLLNLHGDKRCKEDFRIYALSNMKELLKCSCVENQQKVPSKQNIHQAYHLVTEISDQVDLIKFLMIDYQSISELELRVQSQTDVLDLTLTKLPKSTNPNLTPKKKNITLVRHKTKERLFKIKKQDIEVEIE